MESNKKKTIRREVKHSHLIQTSIPVTFMIIWILDSQIFSFSVILNNFVPLIARIILFAIVLIIALILIKLSHDALFHGDGPSNTLNTNGILSYVRNPMYLGFLLIYLSFLFLSISLICITIFIIIVLIYNKMVNYEERVLEGIFGDDYLEYKKRVPKWIPKIF